MSIHSFLSVRTGDSELSRRIEEQFGEHLVFVYGTLLTGEANHDYYLKDSGPACKGYITGFEMYDIGSFPGIVYGEGIVLGELYAVTPQVLERLDCLEGEGSLYIREFVPVTVDNGFPVFASVYVYNGSVEGLDRIPESAQPYTADWR